VHFFIVPMLSSLQLGTPLSILFFHRRSRDLFRIAHHIAPPSARNVCRPTDAVVDVVIAVVVVFVFVVFAFAVSLLCSLLAGPFCSLLCHYFVKAMLIMLLVAVLFNAHGENL